MKPIHKRLCSLLGSALLGCLILGAGPDALKAQSSANADTAQAGHWIPLPYFRDGTWWLPVNPERPMRLQAEWVSLLGKRCYRLHRGDGNEVLMDEAGRELLSAGDFWEFDASHFGFLTRGADSKAGVVDDQGRIVIAPTLDRTGLEERVKGESWNRGPIKAKVDDLNKAHNPGWTVESNLQKPAQPRALSYCRELGLLAVASEGEMRVWDVHSRCCVWRVPLGVGVGIGDIHILPSGRIFISGGMFKWVQHNYVAVYDLPARRLLAKHNPTINAEPGWLRVAPILNGEEYLAMGEARRSETAHSENAIYRINAISGETQRIYNQERRVSSMLVLKGEAEALLGTDDGGLTLLNLSTGTSRKLPFKAGAIISSLGVNKESTHLAVGTTNGELWSLKLPEPQNALHLENLGGEVTASAFLEDGSGRVAARISDETSRSFMLNPGDDHSRSANPGVMWQPENGKTTRMPRGAGLAVLDHRCLALGVMEGEDVLFYDLVSEQAFTSLGVRLPPLSGSHERAMMPLSINLDEAKMNFDFGTKILRLNKMQFDFGSMALLPQKGNDSKAASAEAKKKSPMVRLSYHGDGSVSLPDSDQKLPRLANDFSRDALFLGRDRMLAVTLLRKSPLLNRDQTGGSLSPSGQRAVVDLSDRYATEVRLVDMKDMRVMSQPAIGKLSENLVDQAFIKHLSLLDEDGHRVLLVKQAGAVDWSSIRIESGEEVSSSVVEMIDYAGGKTLSKLLVEGDIEEVISSPSVQSMLVLTDDQLVHQIVWDEMGGLRAIGQIKLNNDGTWYARIPSGAFMANGAEQVLSLASATGAIPLQTAAPAFHRPHEVAAAFGADEARVALLKKAWERRTKKQGIKTETDGSLDLAKLPKLRVDGRNRVPLVTAEKQVRFEVSAEPFDSPLTSLLVSVNGVPAAGQTFQSAGKWSGSTTVELGQGRNLVHLSVTDADGRESLRESIIIQQEGAATSKPDLYVVVVGVSDYANNELDLGAAAKDANDLAAFMERGRSGEFEHVKVLKLTDGDATREHILAARTFLSSSRIEDQVIVFVAGHGFVDEDGLRYWFGTHDIDVQAVDRRGVSYDELEGLFEGVKARRRLLLMDTCFAGEVDADAPEMLALANGVKSRSPAIATVIRKPADGSFDLMKEMFNDLRRNTGATVITASSGMEFVFAEERAEGDNGVFTYCLLEGLRTGKADGDGDGAIHLSELQSYLFTRVPAMTGGRQRPTGRQVNPEEDFVIGTATLRPSFDASKFLNQFFELTAQNGNERSIAALFAPAVDYFGKGKTPDQIVLEEADYYQRFPQRTFKLAGEDPITEELGADRKHVLYTMTYSNVSRAGEIKSGNQNIAMDVVLHGGTWKISGMKVLQAMPDAAAPAASAMRGPTTPPVQNAPLQGAIVQFLAVSSANGQENQFADMFADSVDYFGKRFTRAQIYADEVASHRSWPYRRLSLAGPVEQINVSATEVILRYTMSNWQSKTPSGGKTSNHAMEMHLRQSNGKWFITEMKVRKP